MSELSRAQYSQLIAENRGKYAYNSDALSIAQLFEFVKSHDETFLPHPVNPMLLNDDGTPKVVYHGSTSEFNVFRISERGSLGRGIYFSESEEYARGHTISNGKFTGKVYAAYLSIKNPYIAKYAANYDMEQLKAEGYDGIYHPGNGFYVAFSPTQIKSATANIGTFDKNDPDIRYSLSKAETAEERAERLEREAHAALKLQVAFTRCLARTKAEAAEVVRKYAVNAQDSNRFSEYDKPIVLSDIDDLRPLKDKSINSFQSQDIEKTQKWAYKFYKELGIKSPFFRAWFGDWRAHDRNNVEIVTVPTIDISQAKLEHGDYIIPDTGWEIHAGKVLNDDTRHHTGGSRINVKALNAIEAILRNSILLDTIVSDPNTNKKSPNTAFLHKLYTIVTYNGKPYIAKTTVEEYYNETTNRVTRRAYNLKAIKIEPAGGQLGTNSSSSVPDTSSMISIADLYAFVKGFDAEFVAAPEVSEYVLNEDGTPKVVYHGTKAEFTEFILQDEPKFGRALGDGFYFTPDYDKAHQFANGRFSKGQDRGGIVMPVYLRMEKPFVIEENADRTKWYREYNKGDYDGIIDLKRRTWYVEDATQIKSATNNIGTFDKNDPDIRYSLPKNETAEERADRLEREAKREKARWQG